MSWISEKLFGKRRTYEEEFACNLYDALVLRGGPSSEADSHIDAVELEVPLDKLERFFAKRLIMHEAMLFVASNVATMPDQEKEQPPSISVHPLAVEMGTHLKGKWMERGIDVGGFFSVGERCFAEIETFLEKPFKWGRAWLDEFYSDPEKSGQHYIMWTDQCLKEFETMKLVIREHV